MSNGTGSGYRVGNLRYLKFVLYRDFQVQLWLDVGYADVLPDPRYVRSDVNRERL